VKFTVTSGILSWGTLQLSEMKVSCLPVVCLWLKGSLVLVLFITITFTTSIQYCNPQIHMKYMLQNCTAVV